jgi:hypothetical protein
MALVEINACILGNYTCTDLPMKFNVLEPKAWWENHCGHRISLLFITICDVYGFGKKKKNRGILIFLHW